MYKLPKALRMRNTAKMAIKAFIPSNINQAIKVIIPI